MTCLYETQENELKNYANWRFFQHMEPLWFTYSDSWSVCQWDSMVMVAFADDVFKLES